MKSLIRITALTALLTGYAAFAQQAAPPIDPNAPTLTLDEKIALTTDELKKQDILDKLQKQFDAQMPKSAAGK